MKRSGFKRREIPRSPVPAYTIVRPCPPARIEPDARSVPKEAPLRSEPYRRLVAALPCINCSAQGRSQAAHPNTGKGAGLKTDDRRCFPLCAPALGEPGCHALFDQGALYTKAQRRELEPVWGAETRRVILEAGQWPANLPLYAPHE